MSDAEAVNNPLTLLGFGIVAYVDMLYYFIWLFALFSVMLTPVFLMYGNGT